MVAVDEARKPVPVMPLTPVSIEDRRRFAAAEVRKEMRRELETRFAVIRTMQ
jgi:acyl-CoA hydrolase